MNPSIQATVMSKLDGDEFEARNIMTLNSHKNEAINKAILFTCQTINIVSESLFKDILPQYQKVSAADFTDKKNEKPDIK